VLRKSVCRMTGELSAGVPGAYRPFCKPGFVGKKIEPHQNKAKFNFSTLGVGEEKPCQLRVTTILPTALLFSISS
jgi:hypothetical protein